MAADVTIPSPAEVTVFPMPTPLIINSIQINGIIFVEPQNGSSDRPSSGYLYPRGNRFP